MYFVVGGLWFFVGAGKYIDRTNSPLHIKINSGTISAWNELDACDGVEQPSYL
ncbi:hypothetical protein QUB60_01270 [Microcoleus sp. A2-C5]|uniref:hypothetical protein n=1 Tax=unclassified Microcoleus TaxID=2642155 RepID=UPI002FD18AFC